MTGTNVTYELSDRRVKRDISNLLLSLFVEISTDAQYCKVIDACVARGYKENLVMSVIDDANSASEKHQAA